MARARRRLHLLDGETGRPHPSPARSAGGCPNCGPVRWVEDALAFRGGTALHKLHLAPAARYSDRAHLHQFELADGTLLTTPFEPGDELGLDDRRTRLSRLAPGEQFLYTFDLGDDWVLVAGKPGWGALDWPTEGTPIATGEYDADLDEITDLIRDAAIEGWQKIKAAAEPDPAYRMVYAEDVEPGMVLLDDDGTEMTVLDVRARDAVVSVVLVDDAGWQRSGYFAPLQQARLLVR